MKVGVKFCGGCNPYIDRMRVIERVKSLLPPGEYIFEYFDFNDCEIFIVINGCSVACAKFTEREKVITVSGFEVNGKQYPESELPFAVAKELLSAAKDA